MLNNLLHGLNSLGNGQALAYLFGGSLLGMFLGVIPGLGGIVVLTIVLALIDHINLTGAICLFLAVQAASYFSASVTSILLNTPAHPEAFAVTFDGFPMAQRGEAGRALGLSATSTCVGGLLGCVVLIGFIQVINNLQTIFHPPEYVALITIALLLVGTLGTDAASKALISAGIGLMISTIGSDPITGVYRFTFGAVGLFAGISLVALAMGLFAIPQMVLIFGTATTIARQNMMGQEVAASTPIALNRGFGKQVIQGCREALRHWAALVRAGLIGVITGVVPGIGGFAANFLSYGVAQQMSKKRELFGTGIPEGIIAPEGSSLAKEAGGMVPILGLGIPGGVGGALFLAALGIKGVKVGYGFAQQYPALPYEMAWVIALGGLIGTTAGLLASPLLARVTRVPGPLLVPIIMATCVLGPFVADVSFFSVMEVFVFAVIGLCLRRLRYSLASFAIGLVLGPTLEINLYLTHEVFPGFAFLKRPLADVLFLLAFVILIVKSIQLRREAKGSILLLENELEHDNARRAEEIWRRSRQQHPFPLLSVVATLAIAIFAIAYTAYAAARYGYTTALMPVIAGGLASLAALWRLPFEIYGYVSYRKARSGLSAVSTSEVSSPIPSPKPRKLGFPAVAIPGFPGDPFKLEDPTQPIINRVKLATIREKEWGCHGQYTREVIAFAWFTGLIAGCYVFGFNIGIPTFVLAYGLTATRRVFPRWVGRVVFGVIAATLMFVVTYEIQNVLHLVFTPLIHF